MAVHGVEVRRIEKLKITVVDSPDESQRGRSHTFARDEIRVGANSELDLSVEDRSVSREHLSIRAEDHGWLLSDLDSTNGSFIGELRIHRVVVREPTAVRIGKTLLNLEPMCRKLDPDMDPVGTMKESAMRLLEEQIRRDISTERLMSLLLEVRSFLYDVPLSVRRVLTQLANNELRVGVEVEKADEMQTAIRDVANRITLGVITAALIMGSALLVRAGAGPRILDLPIISFMGFLLAAGLGVYVVFQILTGRH
jgi:hypothetical protein